MAIVICGQGFTKYEWVDVSTSGGGGGGGGDPCLPTLALSSNDIDRSNVVVMKVVLPPDPCDGPPMSIDQNEKDYDEVIIVDLNGRVVFQGKPTERQIEIKTNGYKRGLYIATYQYKGAKLQRRFIID